MKRGELVRISAEVRELLNAHLSVGSLVQQLQVRLAPVDDRGHEVSSPTLDRARQRLADSIERLRVLKDGP